MNKLLKKYIIGSSAFMMIIPLIYITQGFKGRTLDKKTVNLYTQIMVGLPIFYGLVYTLTTYKLFIKGRKGYFIAGAIAGLIFSVIGRFLLNAPKVIFGMEKDKEWMVHPIAIVTYSLIFGLIMYQISDTLEQH
jgi:hypothetical protein